MSWHCLQELEAGFSVESYLAGIASGRWKLRNTRERSCSPANVTESSQGSQSGMTCGHLTGNPGAALSMSSAAASPAKTYPARERESESAASAADSGLKCTESFARYDHGSHSWKTPQCSLLEGLDEFSETWPKQGMMRAGRAYPLPTAARPTAGKESGYLHMMPTPTACNAPNTGSNTNGPKSLLDVARTGWNPGQQWRTPNARDYKGVYRDMDKLKSRLAAGKQLNLNQQVVMYPTPQVADNKFAYNAKRENIEARKGKHQMCLAHAVQQEELEKDPKATHGGALNPPWVEWLMGWPIGWTDLKPLETDRFQSWLQQHSAPFTNN